MLLPRHSVESQRIMSLDTTSRLYTTRVYQCVGYKEWEIEEEREIKEMKRKREIKEGRSEREDIYMSTEALYV